MTRAERLDEVARIAVRIEAECGLPAQALIAQWALESQWGAKPCGQANYFGIKAAARHAKTCMVDTQEVVCHERIDQTLAFADYGSLEESCRDYAWLITHGAPYAQAWADYKRTGDVLVLIQGIARRYASAPSYAALAGQIARQENVRAAIDRVRGSAA